MKLKKAKGWFLIEAMISMAIFAMLASVLISLSVGALNPWLDKKNNVGAEILANEGLESVRIIQMRAWNELTFQISGLEWLDSSWRLIGEGSQEIFGQYTRQLVFNQVCRDSNGQIAACPAFKIDPYIISVKSVVSWQNYFGLSKVLERQVYLSDWQSRFWQQDDWSGGGGQGLWSDITKYDSQQNVNASTTGQITLADNNGVYSLSGYLISSAFNFGAPGKLQVIEWSDVVSASSSLKLQVRAAVDDNGVPGIWSSWYGANGPNTYFASSAGSLISRDLNDNQWVQYRAELAGDSSTTPILLGVKINYK